MKKDRTWERRLLSVSLASLAALAFAHVPAEEQQFPAPRVKGVIDLDKLPDAALLSARIAGNGFTPELPDFGYIAPELQAQELELMERALQGRDLDLASPYKNPHPREPYSIHVN